MKRILLGALLSVFLIGGAHLVAQNDTSGTASKVQAYTQVPLTAITATAAVNTTAVLTIPAPTQSGYYNYVCSLGLQGNNDNTATVVTNAVTTSTNFNAFAAKLSVISSASNDTGVLPLLALDAPGCAKSTSPTTSTTFTSPQSLHEAYTWYATYFQAP